MSPQAEQQRRLRKEGKCIQCWQPSNGKSRCPSCAIKQRESNRKRAGCNPWVEGGAGRPHIY